MFHHSGLSPSASVSMWKLAGVGSLVGAAFSGLYKFWMLLSSLAAGNVGYRDFDQDYLLAKALAAGIDPNTPLPDLARAFDYTLAEGYLPHPTPHPPTLGLLMLPLTWVDANLASVLWCLLSLAFLGLAVLLMAKLRSISVQVPLAIAVALAALAWEPLWEDILTGQVNSLLLLILTAALLLVRDDRMVMAGVLLGLSVLIKPMLWPLGVVLLSYRRWGTIAPALGVVLTGYCTATFVIGPSAMQTYLTSTALQVGWIYRGWLDNISLNTVGWRLLEGTMMRGAMTYPAIPPLTYMPELARPLGLAITSGTLLISLYLVRRMPLVHSLGAMIPVCIAISPVAWMHYVSLCLIPLALCASRRSPSTVATLGLILPGHWAWFTLGSAMGSIAYLSMMPTLAVLAVFALAVNSLPTGMPRSVRLGLRPIRSQRSG